MQPSEHFNPALFSVFMRLWMKQTGRDEAQVGRELGLQPATVHALVTGATIPARTPAIVKRFAVLFGVPEEFAEILILGREDLYRQAITDIAIKIATAR